MTPRALPGPWDANRLSALWLVALLPALAVALIGRGAGLALASVLAVALALAWHMAFARLRRRAMTWDGAVTALVFVLLIPAATPLWQQALALSFGLVLADLVFGGRGRGFLSPAAAALAFALFSFPPGTEAGADPVLALAGALGGALLLAAGVLSWRVVAAFAVALAAATLPQGLSPTGALLTNATLILGLVFLVADPVGAACTNAGRWAHGALAGALVALLAQPGGGLLAPVVFAAVLAGIMAPLIDQAAVWANVRRRARRASAEDAP